MDYPFRTWRLLNGAIFGVCVAALVVTAWVLYRDTGRAVPNTQAAERHRFTVTALLVKVIPRGINDELELGVLDAADADDARAKFSVYVKGKNPGHELKDVMAMAVQQGG